MNNNSFLFSTSNVGQRNLTFPNNECNNLYEPLCLQLEGNKKIKTDEKSKDKVEKSNDGDQKSKVGKEIEAYTPCNEQIKTNAEAPQGLISVFKGKKIISTAPNGQQVEKIEYRSKIKISICVTIFKEKLPDLENTLKGISANLQDFLNMGIQHHEIAVFVIFDGISHVYNDSKEFSSYHNNIISFFNQVIDKNFNVKGDDTLQSQYEAYKRLEEHFNEFSPQKLEKIKQNKQLFVKLAKKYEKELEKKQQEKVQKEKEQKEKEQKEYGQKGKEQQENDQKEKDKKEKELQKLEVLNENNAFLCMNKLYEDAVNELNDKKNKAWVYQIEHQMPIFFVFKYANGRKLSSHNWFFAFCEELQPEFVILLDVGCVPQKESLALLVKELKNEKVGGVCGTMRIKLEKEQYSYDINLISHVMAKIFSIQRCQQCEYDLGHILDKQYESSLDYVHVLPGAFSAYKYAALKKNESTQIDPLNVYLKCYWDQKDKGGENFNDIQEANMYLAEDRVLCAQLYFNGFYLRYVPDSYAEVDPMLNLIDLMFQRRRWINGSWFALNKVVQDFRDYQSRPIDNNNEDNIKKRIVQGKDLFLFTLSLIFAQIGQITQYFYQTFQIVWIYMIMKTIVITGQMWSDFLLISLVIGIYLMLILSLILLSLSYDPVSIDIISKMEKKYEQGQKAQELKNWYFDKFHLISTILGIFNYVVIVYTISLLINDIILGDMQFSFIYNSSLPQNYYILLIIISFGTNALPFLFGIICFKFKMIFSILRNLPAYLFYQPTYNNVFVIYSFCRIDDLSWGTKGLHMDSKSNIRIDKQYSKFIFILQWLVLNIIVSTIIFLILNLSFYLLFQSIVLGIGVLLTILSIIKGIFALIFQLRDKISLSKNRKNQPTVSTQKDTDFYKNIVESFQKY